MKLNDYTVYFFDRKGERISTNFYPDSTLSEVVNEMQAACFRRGAHYAKIYPQGIIAGKGRCVKIVKRYY